MVPVWTKDTEALSGEVAELSAWGGFQSVAVRPFTSWRERIDILHPVVPTERIFFIRCPYRTGSLSWFLISAVTLRAVALCRLYGNPSDWDREHFISGSVLGTESYCHWVS